MILILFFSSFILKFVKPIVKIDNTQIDKDTSKIQKQTYIQNNRISTGFRLNEETEKQPSQINEQAFKLADQQVEIFVLLDSDVDNELSVNELEFAFKNYKWPKEEGISDNEWSQQMIGKYGSGEKLNFQQFIDYLQGFQHTKAITKEKNCLIQKSKNNELFKQIFAQLDTDKSSNLDQHELEQGFKTLYNLEIENPKGIFETFGLKDMLTESQFIVSCMSGNLISYQNLQIEKQKHQQGKQH